MERKVIYQTQRAKDFIAKYAQYWDVPLMSNEQLQVLLPRAQKGDAEAEDTIVRSMMRFVVSVAKNYCDKGLNDEELIETGKRGLLLRFVNMTGRMVSGLSRMRYGLLGIVFFKPLKTSLNHDVVAYISEGL